MIFENPDYAGKADALEKLSAADASSRGSALVAIALNDPDVAWATDQIASRAEDKDPNVRRLVAVCVGHLARIHQALDMDRVAPVLRRLAADDDPDVRGGVEDAESDLRMFLGVRITQTSVEYPGRPTSEETDREADALLAAWEAEDKARGV